MSNNTRPFQQGGAPTPEQLEAFGRITKMLRGSQEYVPIIKELEQIGVEPKFMTVILGEEPTECIVIPLNELMHKEWMHMSGRGTKSTQGEAK
jgi:hypothetical protein